LSTTSNSREFGLVLGEIPPKLLYNEAQEVSRPGNEGPQLVIRKISKSFVVSGGRIQALKNIDLTINCGELVCLVGPSGCGKSTLLNIIAGLDKPDTGEIFSYDDHSIHRGSPAERLLIFQEAALFPWLNVFNNVAYGLKLRKISKEKCESLVEKYLSLVQLIRFKEAYIHQLSGGMKQRVALARALVLEPEILLMDEPFAALDVQTRKDMYKLLLEIREKTAKTILFITHNVDEALMLSNRIVVMTPHPGQIKNEFHLCMGYPRSLEHGSLRQIRADIFQEFTGDSAVGDLGGGPIRE
jgi:NitT/TauT family transport system ATP-binding protein